MQYILIASQRNTLYSQAAGPGGPQESEYAFPAEAASGKLVLPAKDKMILKKLRA